MSGLYFPAITNHYNSNSLKEKIPEIGNKNESSPISNSIITNLSQNVNRLFSSFSIIAPSKTDSRKSSLFSEDSN